VVDYAGLCFKASYDEVRECLRETGRRFPQLHQVYAQGAIHHPACSVFDQLEWSKHCHSVEFDSYPWIYGNFRAGETLRMAEPRYYFAYYRVLCEHLGKPMGFFLDTADQYYPEQVWPLTTASELLYLAAGSGAKRLHTMFVRPMAMQAPRYEKEVQFAKDLRRVMEVSPLLAVSRPARTELGVLNAWSHRLCNPPALQLPEGFEGLGFYSLRSRPLDTIVPNWVEPLNGHETLYRALGCSPDVVDERILEAELPRYRAFALIGGVKTMFARSFDLLWEFVRGGGLLIMDGVPCETPEGTADRRFADALNDAPQATGPLAGDARGRSGQGWRHLAEGLRVRTVRIGQGQLLVVDGDLHDLMSRSYEEDQPLLRDQLVEELSRFLRENGVLARVSSSRPDLVGVYELLADTTRMLTVINHAEEEASAEIVVRHRDGVPAPELLVDLVTGRRIPFRRTEEGVVFPASLPSRQAMIVGVYCDIPVASDLAVAPATVRPSQAWGWTFRLRNALGRHALGRHPVRVRVWTPSGRRLRCFERLVPTSDGVLSGEFVMPRNAEKGTWKVTAYDPFTHAEIVRTFEVA